MRALQAPPDIDIKVYTKLMENHHVRNQNLSLPKGVVQSMFAFSDDDDCDAIFLCIGGQVSCYYFGGGIQSSYAATSIPLKGSSVVAAAGVDGCAYVFSHGRGDVRYCRETAPHSGRFGPETTLELPLPRNLRQVERLLIRKIATGFVVAAVSSTLDSDAFYLSYALFEQAVTAQILDLPFGSANLGLVGSASSSLSVVALDKKYAVCRLRDRQTEVYELRAEDRDLTWTQSDAAGECLFVLAERGGLAFPAVVHADASRGEASIVALAQPGSCEGLCAGFGLGRYHVLTQAAHLNHLDGVPTADGFDAISPAPIEQRCDAFALCGSAAALAAYYFLDGALICLEYDAASSAWKESKVADVTGEAVSALPCYSTEITFTGKHMVPCAGEKLQVWTKSRTFLETPQGTYCTDEAHPATLTTDAQGKVRVLQHVDSVNSNPILVSAENGLLPANEVLAVNQYERQQQRFAALTADEVMGARRSSRTETPGSYRDDPLLDDEHRTRDNAEAIAKSVSQLMAAGSVNSDPSRFGAWLCRRDELPVLGSLTPHDDLGAWQLTVEGARLRYATLSRSDAVRSAQSLYFDENGVALPKWMTSIGNFFRSVAKKIASVVKMVINGVKAVVQVVLNGVKMVFEAVMGVISQVLDMVITIFIAVAVVFIAVFCWLIFHSKWDDILRCKRAFSALALHYLDAYPAASASISKTLDGFFLDAQATVHEAFEPFAELVGKDTTPLQYVDENKKSDPEAEQAQSNNLLIDTLVGNAGSAALDLPEAARRTGAESSGILELIEALTASTTQSAAGGRAIDFMSKRISSYDDLFSLSLSDAGEVACDMSVVVLDAMRQLCSFVFGSIDETCSTIKASITAPLRIPILSEIYEFIAGDDMTVLDMACLIAAIPTALLYKAALGAWPLKSDDDVEAFVSAVSALPLGPGDERAGALTAPLPKDLQQLLAAASAFFGLMYLMLTLVQNTEDITPKPKQHDLSGKDAQASTLPQSDPLAESEDDCFMGWTMVAFEFIWAATACPEATRKPEEPVSIMKWIEYGYPLIGALFDGALLIPLKSYPDHSKKSFGVCWTFGYGFGHLVILILCCALDDSRNLNNKCPQWYELVSSLSCILMELSKIALHSAITWTPLRRVPAVLDVVGIIGVFCNLFGSLMIPRPSLTEGARP